MSGPWTFQGRRLTPHTPADEVGFEPAGHAERMILAQYERSKPAPTGLPSWYREVPMPDPPDRRDQADRAPLLIVAAAVVISAAWAIGIAVNLL